jgi:hypothetical protein
VKTLVANAALGIVSVASVLILIVIHEVLATIADGPGRFTVARRRLSLAIAVLVVVLAVLIVARFYYLRT